MRAQPGSSADGVRMCGAWCGPRSAVRAGSGRCVLQPVFFEREFGLGLSEMLGFETSNVKRDVGDDFSLFPLPLSKHSNGDGGNVSQMVHVKVKLLHVPKVGPESHVLSNKITPYFPGQEICCQSREAFIQKLKVHPCPLAARKPHVGKSRGKKSNQMLGPTMRSAQVWPSLQLLHLNITHYPHVAFEIPKVSSNFSGREMSRAEKKTSLEIDVLVSSCLRSNQVGFLTIQ